jgi:small subunit ribosomal protein S17
MATRARDIGIEVAPPKRACDDPLCPFHGTLPVRGVVIQGRAASTKMERSIVVDREFLHFVPKYERYEKRTRRFTAHHPPCIDVAVGDDVTIMECRPISKTKSFVVVAAQKGALRVAGEDYTMLAKQEAATGAPASATKTEPAPKARAASEGARKAPKARKEESE